MKKNEIANAAVERILRNAGADRVSERACSEFASLLDDIAFHVADVAGSLARHAGRKTIMKDDIKLAGKNSR